MLHFFPTFCVCWFSGIEDNDNWHGKPIPKDRVDELIAHIEDQIQASTKPLQAALPNEDAAPVDPSPIYLLCPPEYKSGDKVITILTLFIISMTIFLKSFSRFVCVQISTRKAYGVALKKMGDASQRIVALDGDTKNSTFSDIFKKAHPDRYIECFIAEQNMVCVFCFYYPM